jgi:hypothetical protein
MLWPEQQRTPSSEDRRAFSPNLARHRLQRSMLIDPAEAALGQPAEQQA